MVTLAELLQTIYEELLIVCQELTNVSDVNDHVGVLDRTEDIVTPFFGFEWNYQPLAKGMGGNRRPVSTSVSGSDFNIETVRDYRLILDFGVVVDGDVPRQRDQYLGTVQSHFSYFIDNTSELHEDITRMREGSGSPSNAGQTGNVGFRATFEIDFKAYDTVTEPVAESVNLNVDVDGTDTYPENY